MAAKPSIAVPDGPAVRAAATAAVGDPAAAAAGPEASALLDYARACELLPALDEDSKVVIKSLPAACAPQAEGRGAKNFTIKSSDGRVSCEVQLRNRCFRVERCEGFAGCRVFSFRFSPPAEAWLDFKRKTLWDGST